MLGVILLHNENKQPRIHFSSMFFKNKEKQKCQRKVMF